MIVGARCTNPKCKNSETKEIFNPTGLTKRKLGSWNGPWKCPDCDEEMYTVRRDTGKAEGKRTLGKTVRHRVSAPSNSKPRRKKPPAKSGKKSIARKKS